MIKRTVKTIGLPTAILSTMLVEDVIEKRLDIIDGEGDRRNWHSISYNIKKLADKPTHKTRDGKDMLVGDFVRAGTIPGYFVEVGE